MAGVGFAGRIYSHIVTAVLCPCPKYPTDDSVIASYPCPNAGFFRVWTERQRGPGVKGDPPGRAHSRFNIIIRPFD